MIVRVPMSKVMLLLGGKPVDKVIEFDRADFVATTGVEPEGKTEDQLVTALAESYLADSGSRSN